MRKKIEGKCQFDECDNDATSMEVSRDTGTVGVYCDYHAELIQEQGCSEYHLVCPNCNCGIRVN